jgi:hypothetical protein
MERFVRRANINFYLRQLSQVTEQAKREQLLRLLAEEEAKEASLNPSEKPKYARRSSEVAKPQPFDERRAK